MLTRKFELQKKDINSNTPGAFYIFINETKLSCHSGVGALRMQCQRGLIAGNVECDNLVTKLTNQLTKYTKSATYWKTSYVQLCR